jgi:hypothetical protein
MENSNKNKIHGNTSVRPNYDKVQKNANNISPAMGIIKTEVSGGNFISNKQVKPVIKEIYQKDEELEKMSMILALNTIGLNKMSYYGMSALQVNQYYGNFMKNKKENNNFKLSHDILMKIKKNDEKQYVQQQQQPSQPQKELYTNQLQEQRIHQQKVQQERQEKQLNQQKVQQKQYEEQRIHQQQAKQAEQQQQLNQQKVQHQEQRINKQQVQQQKELEKQQKLQLQEQKLQEQNDNMMMMENMTINNTGKKNKIVNQAVPKEVIKTDKNIFVNDDTIMNYSNDVMTDKKSNNSILKQTQSAYTIQTKNIDINDRFTVINGLSYVTPNEFVLDKM